MATSDSDSEKKADVDLLIDRAKGGNLRAFEKVLEHCADRLIRLALSKTRDRERAEELVQEASIKAFKSLHGFIDGSICAWLRTVLINAWIDQIRKRPMDMSLDDWIYDVFAPETQSPLGKALDSAFYDDFNSCVGALPAESQVVLNYRYGMDLKLREIAQLLFHNYHPKHINEVDRIIRAAKRQIANCLRDKKYPVPSDIA